MGDTLTTFADSADPTGLAFGPDGSLYLAEWTRNRVRRRAPDGTMTVVTGTGVAGFSGDGGPAELAQVNRPNDVAVGPDGAVFIADASIAVCRPYAKEDPITIWSIVEVSPSQHVELVGDEVQSLPRELVIDFLNELVLQSGTGFGITPSMRVTLPLGQDKPGRGEPSQIKELARSGARGFELIVGTSVTPGGVLEWLMRRGYRAVTEMKTESREELFEGMFPDGLVGDALDLSTQHGLTTLIGFAHDADPIWVVHDQSMKGN